MTCFVMFKMMLLGPFGPTLRACSSWEGTAGGACEGSTGCLMDKSRTLPSCTQGHELHQTPLVFAT